MVMLHKRNSQFFHFIEVTIITVIGSLASVRTFHAFYVIRHEIINAHQTSEHYRDELSFMRHRLTIPTSLLN